MNFKQKVYQECLQVVNGKIDGLQKALNDLKESISNETKSTAGDKHETARAHLQIEQEHISRQLKEVLDQKAVLDQTDFSMESSVIIKGSLVKTGKGYLLISIAAGKLNVDGITVFALSPLSPLGTKLMGQQTGDAVKMNDIDYTIEAIY